MAEISIAEADVWDALQVDLAEDGSSPPQLVPVDRAFIRTLIEAAEERIEGYVDQELSEFEDGIPSSIQRAVILDVLVHYRNRLAPEMPDEYFALIANHRVWGFG
ncbi:head-tail connector protein [Rhizobium puerariae]|uniref:Head-tail connector protein n=1 Tax=Rhizobium puerariae TaxID=1585791 RepID=A0ABV6ANJ5_9HYPH